MPDSRSGRAWFSMLVALVALLAFAGQAAATEYEDAPDEPVACPANYEDGCSVDEPPVACVSGDYEEHDPCSKEEPVDEPESGEEKPDDSESDEVRSCEDGPVARSANGSEDDGAEVEDGCLPHFVRSFIRRVWKFVGEVDYYEEGVLSMTLHRILNLPRKWRTEDDELLDQDATVLVSERVRVFKDGERVGRDALEAANDVRVHGKLMRPFNWLEDEDGETVPTIRAKKVYVTG